MRKHDSHAKDRSLWPLKPYDQLFALGVILLVISVISFGWTVGATEKALQPLQPWIERGEPVPCRVLSRSGTETYVVEYQLEFEDAVRRARISGAPGLDFSPDSGAGPGGESEQVSLLYDPLDPGAVVFAEALEPLRAAAVADIHAWKPLGWLALLAGALLCAFTFHPQRRLARERRVPLLYVFHNDPDYDSEPASPAVVGRSLGCVGALAGTLTVAIFMLVYLAEGRTERFAQRGVPIRGEVIESFTAPDTRHITYRFRVRYALEEGGSPIESTTEILGGIRARRFEVEEGETRAVELICDPQAPKSVRFALSMQWELTRAREWRSVAALVMTLAAAITIASALLHLRCRRILRDDPEESPPRRSSRPPRRSRRSR